MIGCASGRPFTIARPRAGELFSATNPGVKTIFKFKSRKCEKNVNSDRTLIRKLFVWSKRKSEIISQTTRIYFEEKPSKCTKAHTNNDAMTPEV